MDRIESGRSGDGQKARPPPDRRETLADLEARTEFLHVHMTNLAHALGVFHGLNDRLRDRKLSGRGALTVGTVLFDYVHLIAIRVNALVAPPKRGSEVSLKTFVDAPNDPVLQELVVERAAGWQGSSFEETNRKKITARVNRLSARYEVLYGHGGREAADPTEQRSWLMSPQRPIQSSLWKLGSCGLWRTGP